MKHQTLLDGIHFDPGPRSEVIAPSFLRYDLTPDTVDRFFADLRRDDWLDRIKARAAFETRKGLPVVDQGVHRKACIVVVDAACLTPGFPRLNPAKVASAGLVIRREKAGAVEGWMANAEGDPLGWKPVPADALPAGSAFEPDGALRRRRLTHANPALARKATLTGDAGGISETTHPLFAIPPDIAERIGRTLYFTMLPTSSTAVVPVDAPPPPFSAADVATRVPNILQHSRSTDPLPPVAASITRDAFKAATGDPASDAVAGLRSALTWMAQETGLFTGEAYAETLKSELTAIALTGGSAANLYAWFDTAQTRLAERQGSASITTPDAWPAISAARFARIRDAAFAAMSARWGTLSPAVARFGPIGDRYHVRCFLRIDDCKPCPPRVLWSPLSTAYTIRPWYESGGAPPQQIELPPLNADTLRNMKPDVAVKVPPEIQQFMDKLNIDDLLEGEAKKNLNISFGMICGFSIPIITICAFIILQIFLSLLNILFFWLPFVKICIPYPIIEEDE